MNPGSSWRKWMIPAAAVVLLDQISKIVVERFTAEGFSRNIVPGFFTFVHARNSGMAFSLFADSNASWIRPALILFSFAAILFMLWMLVTRRAGAGRTRFGLALILGGAIGNLLDRLVSGSVVDFLDFHLGAYHWPAFNVADSAITIGAALVIFELLFARESHSHNVVAGN
jgi:signal peptidase II